jgi:4'-phosphopantetheinyl transferase
VSQDKQERIKKFRFFQDARNCLLADMLVRMEILRATEFNNRQLEFSVNAYGKPFLINDPHIHYNISHTGNYIACAVANEPVGIDVELIKPADLKIAERFFTPDETKYIKAGDQSIRFYEVWTKKESFVKWEGKGLSNPLPSFSIFDSGEPERLFYHEIFHNEEAICHVCSTKESAPSIRIMNTEDFTRKIHMI